MGDFELYRIAFLFDLGLYYLFVASQPFRHGAEALIRPIYSLPPSTPFFYLMRFYNRRMAAMGRSRRERGVFGRRNAGKGFMFGGFTFSLTSAWPLVKALRWWLWLELSEGWRSWGQTTPKPVAKRETRRPEPTPVAVSAPAA